MIHFSVHTGHLVGAKIEAIQDAHAISDSIIKEGDARQSFDVTYDGGHHWLRVSIRNRENRLIMVWNPIY